MSTLIGRKEPNVGPRRQVVRTPIGQESSPEWQHPPNNKKERPIITEKRKGNLDDEDVVLRLKCNCDIEVDQDSSDSTIKSS